MYCNDHGSFQPPYTFNQIQWRNASINPVGIKVDSYTLRFYERALYQRCMYFLKLNGCPDEWDKNYMFYSLFRHGYVGVIEAQGIDGEAYGVIPQYGTLSGYGIYWQPTRLSVLNKFVNMPLLKINEECGILQLTDDYTGIWDIINHYAVKLALIDKTWQMSMVNSRISNFVFATTKAAAQTLKAAEDRAQAGETMVVFDENAVCPLDPKTMKDPFITYDRDLSKVFIAPELTDLHRSVLNEFDTEIGIPNANLQKKERMSESEVNENNSETYSRIQNWVDTFNRTADVGCNRLFGLNVSAEIRREECDNVPNDNAEQHVSNE